MDLPVLLSVAVFRIPLAAGKYSFPQPTEGIEITSLLKFYPGRLERMALLTVEVEVNGDSKSTNERGPYLFMSLGLSCRYKRFLFSLGQLQNIFFLTLHLFNFFVPIAQQAGQAAVLGRLSLSTDLSWVLDSDSFVIN